MRNNGVFSYVCRWTTKDDAELIVARVDGERETTPEIPVVISFRGHENQGLLVTASRQRRARWPQYVPARACTRTLRAEYVESCSSRHSNAVLAHLVPASWLYFPNCYSTLCFIFLFLRCCHKTFFQVKGKEEPIAVFEPLGAGAVLRTKAANNFLDRGDHADHLQARSRPSTVPEPAKIDVDYSLLNSKWKVMFLQ